MNIDPQIDTGWFQGRLADKRLSQRQLAKRMGLDPAAVSLMLRGKRKMSAAEAADIAVLLGVSADEVLLHAGSVPVMPSLRSTVATDARGNVALVARDVATAAPVVGSADVQAVGMLELPVPMSDGSVARLVLPRAMTKQDAERISAIVGALAL